MKIAWIGTGVMGAKMLMHLVNNNYEVATYNRTYQKAKELEPYAKAYQTIKEAVYDADVIFSIVGYPKDVESVYEEVFKHAKKNAILVDMTTSDPSLAIRLYQKAKEHSLAMLDAPVTGGDLGALKAELSIMVGGDVATYNQVLPLLKLMGKTVTYTGSAGSGQQTKLANQILIGNTLLGSAEAIVFALDNNLDINKTIQVLSAGSATSWQFVNNGQKMVEKNYQPGFYVKHFLKDLTLARKATKYKLEGLNNVCKILEELVSRGYQDLGTQSIILYYLDQVIKTN